jgi:hypothetical protein
MPGMTSTSYEDADAPNTNDFVGLNYCARPLRTPPRPRTAAHCADSRYLVRFRAVGGPFITEQPRGALMTDMCAAP